MVSETVPLNGLRNRQSHDIVAEIIIHTGHTVIFGR